MDSPINWKDDYYVSKERIVLTANELQIPGIRIFATHKIQNAILPLLPHYHESTFEFTLVVKGTMSFYTNRQDYHISGGDVFVSFPDEVHSTNDIPISLNKQYWIQVDISDPNHFLFLNHDTAKELINDLFQIDRHVIATDNKEISNIVKKAFDLAKNKGSQLLIANFLSIFLQLLIGFSRESRYHKTPDIDSAIAYIDAHITDELSLDEVATICNLSTSQFKQKFRHIIGIPPRNYINQKKVEYSKTLLMKGYTITDTAMQLSFNDSSYYSTVFKKYTMETPTDYIRRHKKDMSNTSSGKSHYPK